MADQRLTALNDPNPYSSPSDQRQAAPETAGLSFGRLLRDGGVILLCLASLVLAISAGALAVWLILPPLIFHETAPIVHWLVWTVRLAFLVPGALAGGYLVGRCLSQINPLHVLMLLGISMVAILVVHRGFYDADQGLRFMPIGDTGAVVQAAIRLLATFGLLYTGIVFGRKDRRAAMSGTELTRRLLRGGPSR